MGVTLRHVLSVNLVLVGIDLLTTEEATRQFEKSADLDLTFSPQRKQRGDIIVENNDN